MIHRVSGTVVRERGGDGYTPQRGIDYWTEQDKAEILASLLALLPDGRVSSLDATSLAGKTIEAVGNPVYVSDPAAHAEYGITEPGWYVFARVAAPPCVVVGTGRSVVGASGYIATVGADHIDVAVRFEVASVSKVVVINWDGSRPETYVFKATDLAVRNLDYRVTFYVYPIDDYVRWEYKVNTDDVVQGDGKAYFNLVDGEYVSAGLTVGDPITLYYVESETVTYALTADTVFLPDKDYFTVASGVYTVATVTPGEAVPENTYYEVKTTYEQTTDEVFQEGTTYYTKSETYTVATVTPGEAVPVYYVHAKGIFEGMSRNITYVCNTVIDCPTEFILPAIEDETHGCWFEIRFLHSGSFSTTLTPPKGVKIAAEHTQAETKGINSVDLHYTAIGDIKMWRFLNTHSSLPTETTDYEDDD